MSRVLLYGIGLGKNRKSLSYTICDLPLDTGCRNAYVQRTQNIGLNRRQSASPPILCYG